ncbi:hypothetical protein [Paraburkholderia tropica]|nr:hypothetical protein [Paraburkholderia tropica]
MHKQIGDAARETVEQLYSQDSLDSGSASMFSAPFGPKKQRAAEMLTDDANSKLYILNFSVKFSFSMQKIKNIPFLLLHSKFFAHLALFWIPLSTAGVHKVQCGKGL